MTKPFATVCLALILPLSTLAQRDIEPQLVYADTASFNFTGEWQYLSTDIFLFNGDKFGTLINELDFVKNEKKRRKRRKSKIAQEELEYLFITANLKNVRFFGDKNITYPLYNFQINRDQDKRYNTFVSDNIDHIRIIDNLPLYTASDHIDAELNVKAITNNDRDQIMGMVASQLKNLANITSPTGAVLSIIGEFGNFIESNTKKKEYHFSSTIRLFEQNNFDQRIHSLKLYRLTTANSATTTVNTQMLSDFLDTANNSVVSRATLSNLITYTEYPLVLVVNYKSLYKMEPLSGDEVTFANIEKRKLDIENEYRQNLINGETYRQERDFIAFLTVYANLKNHIDVYTLNSRTGNADATAGSLFRVMQYQRQLLKTFEAMQYKYRGNSTFTSIFEPEYRSILGFAALYLDNDHNLRSIKELVETLTKLETANTLDSSKLEQQIAALHFSGIFKPEMIKQNVEGQLITAQIKRLEEALYKRCFDKQVQQLNATPANNNTRNSTQSLLHLANNTSCNICRDRSIAAINNFAKRLETFNRSIEMQRLDSIKTKVQPWIFRKMELLQNIRTNFSQQFAADSTLESTLYLKNKIAETHRDLNNMGDLLKIDIQTKDYATINSLNTKVLWYEKQVDGNLKLICNLQPELCLTKSTQKPHSATLADAFVKSDSVVRQTNIFIAIFDSQIKQQYGQPDTLSPAQQQAADSTRTLLKNLKTAVNLLESKNLDESTYTKIEKEVQNLTLKISNRLSNDE